MNKSNNFDQQQHSRSLLLSSHQGYLQGLRLSPPFAAKLYQWMEKFCILFLKSSGNLKNHLLIKAPILNKCVNYLCPWLYVAIVQPHLHKPRQIQMMLTILVKKSNTFDQQRHSRSLQLLSHHGYLQGLQLSPPFAAKLYQWMEKFCVLFLKSFGNLKNPLLTKKNR